MTKARSAVPQMRGVSAFLSQPVETPVATSTVSISKIRLPANQPRRYFDPDKLQQLTESVRQHGILEPLLVRPLEGGEYELVAGERRYRAAQAVGLEAVPVAVRELSDQEAVQLALVENLQREDLNPVEETEGVLDLLTLTMGCSRAEISEALTQMATAQKKGSELSGNVSRQIESIASVLSSTIGLTPESFRTSRLPLLNLPSDVLDALRQGSLEYTKARAIAKLKDASQQKELLERVIKDGMPLSRIQAEISAINQQNQMDKPLTLRSEFDSLYSRLKKSGVWKEQAKQKRLKKLLTDIESLLGGEDLT